jgi:glycosyltransferase involved in cell wall biosynthesis
MCAGLPIVTTPVDGCSELVTDEEHGLHVPVQSPAALGEAVSELLGDETAAVALGRAAGERVRDEFTTESMVRSFESIYRDLGSV